jgi:hypothetical protein
LKVVYLRGALRDLQAIRAYIAQTIRMPPEGWSHALSDPSVVWQRCS